jgi:hypothetical protein
MGAEYGFVNGPELGKAIVDAVERSKQIGG